MRAAAPRQGRPPCAQAAAAAPPPCGPHCPWGPMRAGLATAAQRVGLGAQPRATHTQPAHPTRPASPVVAVGVHVGILLWRFEEVAPENPLWLHNSSVEGQNTAQQWTPRPQGPMDEDEDVRRVWVWAPPTPLHVSTTRRGVVVALWLGVGEDIHTPGQQRACVCESGTLFVAVHTTWHSGWSWPVCVGGGELVAELAVSALPYGVGRTGGVEPWSHSAAEAANNTGELLGLHLLRPPSRTPTTPAV